MTLSMILPVEQPIHVDIIIPVYNEEDAVFGLHHQLKQAIDPLTAYQFNIYYVDDGSTDNTQSVLTCLAGDDARVTVLELSRNFGHQAALTAGLDQSTGDYVVTMDG